MRRYSPQNPGPVAHSFARYIRERYGVEISPSQAQALFSYHSEWQRWRNAPGGEAEQEKRAAEAARTGMPPKPTEQYKSPVSSPGQHTTSRQVDPQNDKPEPQHHQHGQDGEGPVAPINRFVAQLQNRDGRGWLPDVPPTCGGVRAKVLSVLRDPGNGAQRSGFLSLENRDPTTAAQMALFEKFRIDPRHVLPWNAYPWYIDRKPAARELDVGAEVLADLIDLLPNLEVVLLQGNEAAAVWDRVVKSRPQRVQEGGLEVLTCIHPSPQALRTDDQQQREARKLKQQRAYQRVAEILATSADAGTGEPEYCEN